MEQLKDICIKAERGSNLAECLEKYTKPRLKALFDIRGEKIASSAKKSDMVEKAEELIKGDLLDFLKEKPQYKQAIDSLAGDGAVAVEDMEALKKLDVMPLYERGYLFVIKGESGVTEVLIPGNIAAIATANDEDATKDPEIKNIDALKEATSEISHRAADLDRSEEEKEVMMFASALANIYGVYPASQLKEVWDFNHQRGISPSDLNRMLLKSGDEDGFYINDNYLVSNLLPSIDAYCEVLEKLERSDIYYYPDEETIKENADKPNYEAAQEYVYIRSFLERKLGSDDAVLDKLMEELFLVCTKDSTPAEVVAFMKEKGVDFDDLEEFNNFISLYTWWFYNINVWACKGHKPANLKPEKIYARNFKLPAGIDPRKKVKVGRNDTCPCGSGKKFKNCCAKHF